MQSDADNTIGTILTSLCHPGYARPGFGVYMEGDRKMNQRAQCRHRANILMAAIILAITVIGCSGAGGKAGETRVQPLTSMSAFDHAVRETSKDTLVIVDFYADWCAPCKQLSPVIDALSVDYADQAVFYKVDVDKLNPVLERFGITAIPYVLFFKNGRPVKALPGLQPKSAYKKTIRTLS